MLGYSFEIIFRMSWTAVDCVGLSLNFNDEFIVLIFHAGSNHGHTHAGGGGIETVGAAPCGGKCMAVSPARSINKQVHGSSSL